MVGRAPGERPANLDRDGRPISGGTAGSRSWPRTKSGDKIEARRIGSRPWRGSTAKSRIFRVISLPSSARSSCGTQGCARMLWNQHAIDLRDDSRGHPGGSRHDIHAVRQESGQQRDVLSKDAQLAGGWDRGLNPGASFMSPPVSPTGLRSVRPAGVGVTWWIRRSPGESGGPARHPGGRPDVPPGPP
jgi:hypothetical protein